ncbi:MAG: hypothetical protein L6W00_10920 [Lentisphaeria bacterium]|nr:MAG: hypothetical protein L6W00_10920 [Lentisphaeria bacterium]
MEGAGTAVPAGSACRIRSCSRAGLAGLDPNRPSRLALTRDIQQRMMELPGVGIATAVDIGEADNIHPPEKREVGRRLALEALRMVYGRAVVSRGPLFRSVVREGNPSGSVSTTRREG